MAILPIRLLGDPVLRSPAAPVEVFDDALKRLAADMLETMDAAPGVGLAAPQVGVPRRLFVFDDGDGTRGAICNPELVWTSEDMQEGEEGCLSLPGVYFPLERAWAVEMRGLDLDGEPVSYRGEELLARIFQHERDHLDGVLFIDRLDPATRKEAMRQLRERDLEAEQRAQRQSGSATRAL